MRADDLYAAVERANAAFPEPYTIYLLGGRFPLDETITLTGNVTVRGQGIGQTIIHQTGLPSQMGGMFSISGGSITVHNITFQDGRAQNGVTGAVDGGAFRVWSGELSVYDSAFFNNRASGRGGAIDVQGGTLTADRVIFGGNSARLGGAVSGVDLSIECGRFVSNEALESGGAIFGNGSARLSSFSSNRAATIGAQIEAVNVFDASDNWWAARLVYPNEIAFTVNVGQALADDPTLAYSNGLYDVEDGPCAMRLPDNGLAATLLPTPTPIPWSPASGGLSGEAEIGFAAGSPEFGGLDEDGGSTVMSMQSGGPPPANTNLIVNPTISSTLSPWLGSYAAAALQQPSGVTFTQNAAPGHAVVYQPVNYTFSTGMTLAWTVDVTRVSASNHQLQLVLQNNNDWASARICTFQFNPTGLGASRYTLYATVPATWGQLYAAAWTLGGAGSFRYNTMDLRYLPNFPLPTNGPHCQSDPLIDSNLIQNPTFAAGLTHWDGGYAQASLQSGGVTMTQTGVPNYGYISQTLQQYRLEPGMPLVWQIDMANVGTSSGTVRLAVHNGDWSTARVCDFTLPPDAAPRAYTMTLTVPPVPPDTLNTLYAQVWTLGGAGSFRYTRMDLRYQPSISVPPTGVNCHAPTAIPEFNLIPVPYTCPSGSFAQYVETFSYYANPTQGSLYVNSSVLAAGAYLLQFSGTFQIVVQTTRPTDVFYHDVVNYPGASPHDWVRVDGAPMQTLPYQPSHIYHVPKTLDSNRAISVTLYDTSTSDNSGSFTVRIFRCTTPPPPPTPTPLPTAIPTSIPTITPTPRPQVTMLFGGSYGNGTITYLGVEMSALDAPGPPTNCQIIPWHEISDYQLQYPGSLRTDPQNGLSPIVTTAKRHHANIALGTPSIADADIFVVGYSAGADSALIFANDYVLARQSDLRSGTITGLLLLGGTLSGSVSGSIGQDPLSNVWTTYLDRILATGTYVYVHDDNNGSMSLVWDTYADTTGRFEHVISSAEHLDNLTAVNACQQPTPGIGTNNSYLIRDTILQWFDNRNVVW